MSQIATDIYSILSIFQFPKIRILNNTVQSVHVFRETVSRRRRSVGASLYLFWKVEQGYPTLKIDWKSLLSAWNDYLFTSLYVAQLWYRTDSQFEF